MDIPTWLIVILLCVGFYAFGLAVAWIADKLGLL